MTLIMAAKRYLWRPFNRPTGKSFKLSIVIISDAILDWFSRLLVFSFKVRTSLAKLQVHPRPFFD
jgi:hypothetical protein